MAPKTYTTFYNPPFEGFHNFEDDRGCQKNRVTNNILMFFVAVKRLYLKKLLFFQIKLIFALLQYNNISKKIRIFIAPAQQ